MESWLLTCEPYANYRAWVRRWCVLKSRSLQYFSDDTAKEKKGEIDLALALGWRPFDASVDTTPAIASGNDANQRRFILVVAHCHGVDYFDAQSEDVYRSWTGALKAAFAEITSDESLCPKVSKHGLSVEKTPVSSTVSGRTDQSPLSSFSPPGRLLSALEIGEQPRGHTNGVFSPSHADTPRRHLVLYMDINKTVVMTDKVGGKSALAVVNETLAAACWGILDDEGKWLIRRSEPSVERPDGTEEEGKLISYYEYVEQTWPGKENRKLRHETNGKFTCEGEPGEKFKGFADNAIENLCPNGIGGLRLLPGFFEMLQHLKREKRSFALCFRTFGDDLPEIATELNEFCEGRHPLFPGVKMDGSDGEADYRFIFDSPEQCGTWHRTNTHTSLVMGTVEQPGEGKYKDATDTSLGFYKDWKGLRVITGEGYDTACDFLQNKLSSCCTMGLRDYFGYWKSKDMSTEGGKPFFFRAPRPSGNHEVFFDDNIKYTSCKIVHPIDMDSPERQPWVTDLLRTHIVKVEPWECIYDRHYFIKHLEKLEVGYERALRARERLKKMFAKVLLGCKVGAAFRKSIIPEATQEEELDESYDPWKDLRKTDDFSSRIDDSAQEEFLVRTVMQ